MTTSFELLSHLTSRASHSIILLGPYNAHRYYQLTSLPDTKIPWVEYNDLEEKVKGMDYIFLAISNDGGSHWTLVVQVTDARGPVTKTCIDGIPVFTPSNQDVAPRTMVDLCRYLRHLYPDRYKGDDDIGHANHSPSQRKHNRCRGDAWSACGPFAWAMAREFVQCIAGCGDEGVELEDGFLDLPLGFAEVWGRGFDSAVARGWIARLVARERRLTLLRWGTVDWFEIRNLRGLRK
ncbi:hypothetical protein CC80DRAFT_559359 [Byssothecium circinans]|uniref:Ubiquitin-like protease family profile domain-containing protein n=1 Tax=Byssothecium circinans TaxID=147558 RepID=A0A6A5U5Y3_9PLEO|nr:hypothetical protein CC80DRAFT_559359 [Byssothecium circinans]